MNGLIESITSLKLFGLTMRIIRSDLQSTFVYDEKKLILNFFTIERFFLSISITFIL